MRLVALLLAAAPAWELVDKNAEYELYQREVPGERLVELKVITVTKLPVEPLCAAAFGGNDYDPAEPGVSSRKLISFDGGVRIAYETVSTPVVNDRDYAVLSYREALPGGGCRTHFEAANQFAPKLPDGYVRIEKLRGGFTFEPVPDGSGRVVMTYVIFADPGGSLPAMFVEGPRKKTAVKWVRMVLGKAAAAQRVTGRDGGRD